MKATEKFKTVIENYLNQTAQNDADFAQSFGKQTKNMESCFNYIYGEVKKTGLCAFDDQEIFDMAVRYYRDETIGQPAPIQCRVAVKQPVENDLFSCPPEILQEKPAEQSIANLEDTDFSGNVSAAEDTAVGHDSIVTQDSPVVEETAALQNTADVQNNAIVQNSDGVKDSAVKQNTAVAQDTTISKGVDIVQNRDEVQDTADTKKTEAVHKTAVTIKTAKSSKTAPKTLTLFDL